MATQDTAAPSNGSDPTPISAQVFAESATVGSMPQSPLASALGLKKKVNILMVDDQHGKLLGYEAILRKLDENLIRANSADEALQCLLKSDIAVALIDVSMPGMDGFQLADMIRQHPRFGQLALIFVSAIHLTDTDKLKGYECGGVDYVSVPIVPELLRAKVKVFAELHRKTQQLAQKNNQLRSLSIRLMTAQDVERRRIARNLHDSLGQYLAGVKMDLDLLAPSVPSDGTGHLSSALDCVERCIAETRTISQLLHPPLLDESGFISAARLYVEGFSQRSAVKATMNLPEELRLPDQVEITLFRILQESLTNVHRHSGSASLNIDLELKNSDVVLIVRDFGKGMPVTAAGPEAFGIQPGIGLTGMRERVGDLGGTLEIQSDVDGTAVITRIPIVASATLASGSGKDGLGTSAA